MYIRSYSSVCLLYVGIALAQDAATLQTPLSDREKLLLDRIEKLEQRIALLEQRVAPPPPPAPPAETADAPARTTLNVLLDGYYEYNFNKPAGRVNLLRPYDPTTNNFTLSQADLVIERAPDPAQGRRFGLRLDLMFGRTTESLAGNPANEPRTAPYRNIFQAYGTYVFPLGTGLTVDFGRFASSLGPEGTFSKDQINYSRSLLFNTLPLYHMGFRTAYKLGKSSTVTWHLENGINQTEDFNGFKSHHFMLSTSFSKNVTWTASYYVGRESRDLPPLTANGRTHIADTYLSWNATPKLTLAGEGDYIVSRQYSNSYPTHLSGGAGYARYHFVPAFSLASRFEYVSDHEYFTALGQAIKEGTLTATYQPAEGFQIRWEYRRDFSNRLFFLTHAPGVLKKEQNTALLGLVWWFGGKQGPW